MAIQSRFRILVAVLGLAAAGLPTHAHAQTAACTGNGKISKQIAKPMDAAKNAQKARKWREVLAGVRDAEAVSFTKTAWDLYWIHEYSGYAYYNLGQHADAARAWEASVASPCQPEADKAQVYKRLANLYFQLSNYPKTIDYANRGLANSRDPELMVTLGQAYFQSGDNKNSLRVMKDVIDGFEKRGQTPKEQILIVVLNACIRMRDTRCETQMYEKLVQNYPKPEYWQNLLSSLMAGDSKDEVKINVMRLAVAVGVMKQPDQFKEMAQIALDQGLPAEAESVIQQATALKIFKDKRQIDLMDRLLKRAQGDLVRDKATLPKREADARAAPSGDLLVKLGASYLSYGENDKAIDSIKRGIAKPNLTLADEAGMLLGIAHLRSKNKVEAAKAFRTVKQDPTMVRIAKLWLLNT
jgi:tetratricopeptide (TPR) repeat protein